MSIARTHATPTDGPRARRLLLAVLLALWAIGAHAADASAAGPVWKLGATDAPTVLPTGDQSGEDRVFVRAVDIAPVAAQGSAAPIVLSARLAPGVLAETVEAHIVGSGFHYTEIPCVAVPVPSCTTSAVVNPYETVEMSIAVDISPSARTGTSEISISGGGAPTVSLSSQTRVGTEPAPFGIEQFDLQAINEDGSPDTQAGSHPYAITSTIALNQKIGVVPAESLGGGRARSPVAVSLPKDLDFELPPGLLGNPTVLAQCTGAQFTTFNAGLTTRPNLCPYQTAIGVADVAVTLGGFERTFVVPLFNLVPEPGEPARFGFVVQGASAYLDTSVRTGSDYGIRVDADDITQIAGLDEAQVTFWGTPGDPSHAGSRGWNCLGGGWFFLPSCSSNQPEEDPLPFVTLPTACTGPLTTTVRADSWDEPGRFLAASSVSEDAEGRPIGLDGCSRLSFDPELIATPDGAAAGTPTGLDVDLRVPHEEDLADGGLAQSTVRTTTVTLPEGVLLSPAGADGLAGCSEAQIGFREFNPGTGLDEFTPGETQCPDAAKIGKVKIDTPLLPDELEGSVYLASPHQNPFGSLLAIYLVARDPISGVLVKLPGEVSADHQTGRLTTTFTDTPQVPFEDLELEFFGSNRAPLTTPPLCGTYTTASSITPWSGATPSTPSSDFKITSGPGGGPCQSPQPFEPGFNAGATNIQAGAFTPFVLSMSRPDADQALGGVSVHLPPGLLGRISSAPVCPEPQAALGTCGPESLIGRTTVSVGLGASPLTAPAGRVYITGPYKGAPYGLTIVNPAEAGPFDLGTVVTRATIAVDPETAALTVTTDPLPTILEGIPLQIQHINVNVDRPGFVFNPTSCAPHTVAAELTSALGTIARAGSPFQVTNCAALGFRPSLSFKFRGKTRRGGLPALTATVTYPKEGSYANISKAQVTLPPSEFIEQGHIGNVCTRVQFAEGQMPGEKCPADSVLGHAKAITPILDQPLEGPVYLRSNGGERELPDLVAALHGGGIDLNLVGFIDSIHRKGSEVSRIRNSFDLVPDAPVSRFTLHLSGGKKGLLVNSTNLCKGSHRAAVSFTGQNGAVETLHPSLNPQCGGGGKKAKGKRHGGAR